MSTESDVEIVSVERIDGTEIIVEFSDSTCATYTTAQLVEIRPNRQRADSPPPGLDRSPQ
jgi:hypothetical protein